MGTGQRPDPLERLDATSEAIRDLRGVVDTEEALDDVLARLATTAAGAIPDADAVTITVLTGEEFRSAAATDERVLALDRVQYDAGDGPCVLAARQREPVRVEITSPASRWPQLSAAAQETGVRACLSVPLLIGASDEQEVAGAVNVYSYTAAAFDPYDEGLMRLFTEAAGAAITNARRWQRSRETITQLEQALTSRADIDQAKGILMALHGSSAEDAFERLVTESQRRNLKVRDIVAELLARIQSSKG